MLYIVLSIVFGLGILFGIYAILDSTRDVHKELKQLHQELHDLSETLKANNNRYI